MAVFPSPEPAIACRLARVIALVPAAGMGSRATGQAEAVIPKQYRVLAGQPMLRHAVLALLADARVQEVRVIVAPQDEQAQQVLSGLPRTRCFAVGGAERSETVLNGLRQTGFDPEDWVLVHDAARPGLPATALSRLLDACLSGQQGGLLAMPMADTVKRANAQQCVERTLDRQQLWMAQTPQMFRAGQLEAALLAAVRAGVVVTDEASAMEAAGYKPLLVPGSGRNAKITWPDDFDWVQSWL
jgi:2-C-methyl-D-erythritol 4-phosphate cytidylyltransferase